MDKQGIYFGGKRPLKDPQPPKSVSSNSTTKSIEVITLPIESKLESKLNNLDRKLDLLIEIMQDHNLKQSFRRD